MTVAEQHTQPTQAQRILARMQENAEGITPLEALNEFGCFRLGARIYELKQAGYQINAEMVPVGEGKRVSRYRLAVGGKVAPVWRCGKCGAEVELAVESVASGWGFAYCRKDGKTVARSA